MLPIRWSVCVLCSLWKGRETLLVARCPCICGDTASTDEGKATSDLQHLLNHDDGVAGASSLQFAAIW